MNKIRVLYLDDEKNNLNSFKATYRKDYEIFLSTNSKDAEEILANELIHVIISDQRMMNVTGVEFFESILNKYPNSVRILLTGYTDIEVIIDAINRGKVYCYVTKPWNEYHLKQMISNAYNYYMLRVENSLLSNRYEKVFQNSSDLILIFDEYGTILDSNKESKKQLSLDKSTSLSKIIEDIDDQRYLIKKLIKNGKVADFECNFLDKNKKVINGIVSANSLHDLKNESNLYQLIFKDVSERKLSDVQVLKKIIEAQEEERSRVADDLHDSLGQELSSVKMMLGVLKDASISLEEKSRITSKSHEILENSIKGLREICFNLMPSALENGGFIPAFKQLVKQLLIEVEINFNQEKLPLSMDKQITLYRVSQEFVNNTLKHSKASKLKLSINIVGENQVNLIFEDNGIGFDMEDLSFNNGRGQNTMLKRIESYGGKSKLESKKGEGTKLKITFTC